MSDKALVVYESMFGNTRDVAQAVGRGLAGRFEVEVVEASEAPAAPDADLIVVGGPIHAMGLPSDATRADAAKQAEAKGRQVVSRGPGVREWLDHLPRNERGVAAAAFDTAFRVGWFAFGSAARGEVKRLVGRDYELLTAPEHFWVTGADGPLAEGEVERAVAWGGRLAERYGARH